MSGQDVGCMELSIPFNLGDGRLALEKGKLDDTRAILEDIMRIGEQFVKTGKKVGNCGERSYWMRSFNLLEVSAAELRGMVATAGPKKG